MKLNEWIEMWNEKIKEWSNDPNLYFENDDIYNSYKSLDKSSELIKSAIPEPYLGDVDSKCSVVMLSLNPGQLLDNEEQVLPNGEFIKDGAAVKYSNWAKKWFYLSYSKDKFWTPRKKWIDRHIGQSDILPFGLELVPYHSKSWGELQKNDNVIKYVDNNILLIAEEMVNKSILKAIVCMGREYGEIFEKLNYEKLFNINNTNYSNYNISWPTRKDSNPKGREYIVWRSPRGYYYLQIQSGAGFATAPAEDFRDTERSIFKIVEEKYNYKLIER